MAKLGIYIVEHKRDETIKSYLVIAEDANGAQRIAEQQAYYDDQYLGVGRLGDFEPGIEGHQMVVALSSKNGILMDRERKASA